MRVDMDGFTQSLRYLGTVRRESEDDGRGVVRF